jgi:hypothetical protein
MKVNVTGDCTHANREQSPGFPLAGRDAPFWGNSDRLDRDKISRTQ